MLESNDPLLIISFETGRSCRIRCFSPYGEVSFNSFTPQQKQCTASQLHVEGSSNVGSKMIMLYQGIVFKTLRHLVNMVHFGSDKREQCDVLLLVERQPCSDGSAKTHLSYSR